LIPQVVVSGGSGFIGGELSALLRRRGLHVVLVSRSQHAHTFPYTDADVITWDALQRNGLPGGTRAVVNLAGENVFNPMRRWNESFKKLVCTH
jgi:NAD dependent epimerase/dehydratase family enzyme